MHHKCNCLQLEFICGTAIQERVLQLDVVGILVVSLVRVCSLHKLGAPEHAAIRHPIQYTSLPPPAKRIACHFQQKGECRPLPSCLIFGEFPPERSFQVGKLVMFDARFEIFSVIVERYEFALTEIHNNGLTNSVEFSLS